MEFQEVMRQAHRLCDSVEFCNHCPLEKADEVCYFDTIGDAHIENVEKYYKEFETIVMKWAAEHPEPTYPTWQEWLGAVFQDYGFEPCVFTGELPDCHTRICETCRNQPIPADIAERLGIKPREAKE